MTVHPFVLKVERYILEHKMISKGDTVLMGVSGGADSTALFLVLLELKGKYNLDLYVLHVNHGLRDEAKEEALSVKKLCEDNNITFFLKEYDVESISKDLGLGTEETGRKLRYEAFNEALKSINKEDGKIAVAHNMSDLSETMLFHLFRGTGIKGLASIAPVRDNIIRPLLCAQRDEIEGYLADRNISFSVDKSNFSDEYTRNRIRNNIIPLIKEHVSKASVEHMAETAEQLREINSFVVRFGNRAYEEDVIKKSKYQVIFNRAAFNKEDPYIKKLLVKMAIDELIPGNRDITHLHIESVVNLLETTGTHKVDLPYSMTGIVSYNEIGIILANEINESFDEVELLENGETVINGIGTFETSVFIKENGFVPERNKYTKCLDYDKIEKSLSIRPRSDGDFLVVNQDGGTKKLKNYFIDEKVPSSLRDSVPLIADGNRILWVVGYRISEDAKVTSETKRIIKITFRSEES